MESLETRQLLSTVTVAAGQNAAEGSQTGYFTFTRDDTAGSLMVNYAIDTTASTAGYGSDYSSPYTSGYVTFSSGQSSVNLNVAPIDDSAVESSESVVLKLQAGSGSGSSYTIGSASSATVLITDNDTAPTINVAATQNATEGSQTGYFTFTRDVTSGSLAVYYSIDQTASTASSSDYSSPSSNGSVTFSAGQSSVTLNVAPVDDSSVEDDESVVLHLQTNSMSSSSYTLGSASSATVLIASDDHWTVSIEAVDNSAFEPTGSYGSGDRGQFRVTRSGLTDFSSPLTISYTIGGTATNGTDYTTLSGTATIPYGHESALIDVSPSYNGLANEGAENVTLTLVESGYLLGSPTAATVTIHDSGCNNPKYLGGEGGQGTDGSLIVNSGSFDLDYVSSSIANPIISTDVRLVTSQ